jgi:hypothetical protein
MMAPAVGVNDKGETRQGIAMQTVIKDGPLLPTRKVSNVGQEQHTNQACIRTWGQVNNRLVVAPRATP